MINKHSHYHIKIQGHLDACWEAWFDDLDIILTPDGDTILSGAIVDQSALHGVLKKVSNLGMPLLSVCPIDPGHASGLAVADQEDHEKSQ
jgi:hypothetical protein